MKKNQAVSVVKEKLPTLTSPESMRNFAVELKKFIVAQNLFTPISGKNYVNVEGWQFAGGSMGLIAIIDKCDRLERGTEVAYRAEVLVYSGERVVSRGIAICSSKESKKSGFDEYAIASMAQTRAVGKAYRLLLGWMMKAAGYEATPAEEMKGADAAAKASGNVGKSTEKDAIAMAEAQINKTEDKAKLESFKARIMDSKISEKGKSRLIDIIQAKIDA